MKGFVSTPDDIVDLMVNKLFNESNPEKDDMVLDPGCGTGAFINGIIRWCSRNTTPIPKIVGIESDPAHIPEAIKKFKNYPSIEIRHEDFLLSDIKYYEYIIGNPPYVPITKISELEKDTYKGQFQTAQGRFDLYFLFYEQCLKSLKMSGRLVLITPEKFMYVASALRLRELICKTHVCEVEMIREEAFRNLTTYPTITTIVNSQRKSNTKVVFRDGEDLKIELPTDGRSWLPTIYKASKPQDSAVLGDITIRVSCGVATGADSVFIKKTDNLRPDLLKYAYPTISGRELTSIDLPELKHSMLIPYTKDGKLIPEDTLNPLDCYLKEPDNIQILKKRTCVARKPWYAFHENPPLVDILRPKILCKDITTRARFWVDKNGEIVPRHSVYYIIPKDSTHIELLCDYLNSEDVSKWLEANCQRAANGFMRLQSNILRHIPIPNNILKLIECDTL